MAIHCMLLTEDNRKIVENFLSEFKDKYDCMQTFDMVRSMISAWQSANFKDGEEPTMPTKDEIEQFIQLQLGKNKNRAVKTRLIFYKVLVLCDFLYRCCQAGNFLNFRRHDNLCGFAVRHLCQGVVALESEISL